MQFLYGDRELLLTVGDIFSASAEVIVSPAQPDLNNTKALAAEFVVRGGASVQQECEQFIRHHGELENGMVAMTSAGEIPYEAILHAVVPCFGDGDEVMSVTRAVSNSLKLCSMHAWQTIAFPDFYETTKEMPVEMVAQGFFHAITSFWDARLDEPPFTIILCLSEANFRPFFDAFRQASMMPDEDEPLLVENTAESAEVIAGSVTLDENEISALQNDEVSDWFK